AQTSLIEEVGVDAAQTSLIEEVGVDAEQTSLIEEVGVDNFVKDEKDSSDRIVPASTSSERNGKKCGLYARRSRSGGRA
ncbi:hypothetical protein A2U01_0063613, partial [Trifolium medium]|nr:hypothetical protein [Trifolium medium]